MEAGIQAAVGIETCNPATVDAVYLSEGTCNDHLAIRLHDNGAHDVVGSGPGVEAGVQAAVGIEACDLVSAGGIDRRSETASDEHLAIGLHGNRVHLVV